MRPSLVPFLAAALGLAQAAPLATLPSSYEVVELQYFNAIIGMPPSEFLFKSISVGFGVSVGNVEKACVEANYKLFDFKTCSDASEFKFTVGVKNANGMLLTLVHHREDG